MNGVLLLAGPPAVGHNTVAAILASSDSPVAVVDGDDLRAMVTTPPHRVAAPSGRANTTSASETLCAIASNFDHAGLATIPLDVVGPETVPLYRELLADVSRFDLVLLIADDKTLLARDRGRHVDPNADPAGLEAWHQRITFLRSKLAASAHRRPPDRHHRAESGADRTRRTRRPRANMFRPAFRHGAGQRSCGGSGGYRSATAAELASSAWISDCAITSRWWSVAQG